MESATTAISRSTATTGERERRERVLQAAEAMLAQGGEAGLQMKQLAQRGGVALGTLYRYFPSKDHVLAAIALQRHERSVQRLDSMRFEGETAGERAADLLIREFRSVQREPEMATAIQRVSHAPDRSTSEYAEAIGRMMDRLVLAAVAQNGDQEVTPEQREVMPIVVAATNGAITGWLSGNLSADQTRARIRAAARLFDLPAETVREFLTLPKD